MIVAAEKEALTQGFLVVKTTLQMFYSYHRDLLYRYGIPKMSICRYHEDVKTNMYERFALVLCLLTFGFACFYKPNLLGFTLEFGRRYVILVLLRITDYRYWVSILIIFVNHMLNINYQFLFYICIIRLLYL